MHSKVINPRQHGRLMYINRGSCKGLLTYLGHEAREQQHDTQFFGEEQQSTSAEEVRAAIDKNTKELRKQQEKFYSLVLSPSEEEIKHMGNDPDKLRQYTRQVMDNYAENFKGKVGEMPTSRHLTSSDLIWYATIHQERKEKQGEQKGAAKVGLHQHVHIIVSAKDRSGELRLNPRGHRSRFSIRDWQVENGKSFQQMFSYEKPTVSNKLTQGMPPEQQERHQQRIRDRVVHLNQYFVGSQKIDVDRALDIGQEKQYGKGFFFNLHRLTKQYHEGKLVNNPYQVLETGKDEKISFPERTLLHLGKGAQGMSQEAGEEEESANERSSNNDPPN
ncbi:MAG: DUF5712 family protein [Tunicatimonas sp.]